MARREKKRLDLLLVEEGLAKSRQQAQALILAGKVSVNGAIVDKAGTKIAAGSALTVHGKEMPYVSRGGVKMEAALDHFQLTVSGFRCLDVGASTGGFTDCLLQRGATAVTCVDVGYGQLDWRLRNDPRVTLLERTNIRYLAPDALPHHVDLVTIDVSFISLRIVVPAVLKLMKPGGCIIALIKPQFEVGKGAVGKDGVVRDPGRHQTVIEALSLYFQNAGLKVQGIIPSPILGPKGNKEFLIFLSG